MPERRRLNLLLPALVFAATVLLVGCASAASANPSGPVKTTHVSMPPSYRFDPATIQVTAGSTVVWTNNDNFTHSVQVDGQSEVHVAKPGESVQITFATPGTYHYVCTFHTQNMQGTVVVTAAS